MERLIRVWRGVEVGVGGHVWIKSSSGHWEEFEISAIYERIDGTICVEIIGVWGGQYHTHTLESKWAEWLGEDPVNSRIGADDFWRSLTDVYFKLGEQGFSRDWVLEVVARTCLEEAERITKKGRGNGKWVIF